MSVTKQPGLADPDQRPGSDIVIFDGNCRFCQQQVKRLAWFDKGNRLSFLSLHDPRTSERFPEFTHEQLMRQMVVIDRQGGRHGGARAVRYLSRRLPQLWWLTPLLHIPFSLPFWEWAYQKIAIRRYRLSAAIDGECTDACEIHLNK
ncbi:MAG: thiol-disulfide oxidoreductase DCC family protein [Pirellulaceae bacterium]